ncbi:Thioesterase superfamily enzyme [Frankia canadensis]|uniref:Thioesterase superfamily enzyme n=1 Tax=Frankia canadensis TaxID=1836972 RepID=A0A2I2KNG6_9ACTN|nr:PaaI family thioesterase [Frankia canadensis]SNQ47196.1 Thioesterase superfamily enzyme [Frankia canadensis]SOU54486.1 Thioesterase superfamily enzyme [Frankia canadensis]
MTAPHTSAPLDAPTPMGVSAAPAAPELPWAVLEDYRCFGCSPHNPHGIALAFTEHPEGLQTSFKLGRSYESYPGVVHGGLLGVVCDETMGNLIVVRTGLVAFTVSLRLRYLSPVGVGTAYTCVARLGSDDPGGPLTTATAEILDADGTTAVTATATYRNVPFGTARERIALSATEAGRLDQALTATAGSQTAQEMA